MKYICVISYCFLTCSIATCFQAQQQVNKRGQPIILYASDWKDVILLKSLVGQTLPDNNRLVAVRHSSQHNMLIALKGALLAKKNPLRE